MSIKPAFIVTDMDGYIVRNAETGIHKEFRNEAAAIKAAKDELKATTEDEIWIWRLSHVVSRPDLEPDVEVVK